MKRQANKKLRQQLKDPEFDVSNAGFKKNFESWEICDYGFVVSWEEHWQACLDAYQRLVNMGIPTDAPNKEEEYRIWEKTYKRK